MKIDYKVLLILVVILFNFCGLDAQYLNNNTLASSIKLDTAKNNSEIEAELDSALESSNLDSLEESEETEKWNVYVSNSFQNKQLQNGTDISGDIPSLSTNFGISHEIGLAFSYSATRKFDNKTYISNINWSPTFTYAFSDKFDATIGYTRYKFNDTNNVLSSKSNILNLSADYYTESMIYDLAYDLYLDKDPLHYLSLTFIKVFKLADGLKLTPMLSICGSAYSSTYYSYALVKNSNGKVKVKKTSDNSTSIQLSSVYLGLPLTYKLGYGFSASANLSFVYTPDAAVSDQKFQYVGKLGIKYSLDF
jgi:hypothetical protein